MLLKDRREKRKKWEDDNYHSTWVQYVQNYEKTNQAKFQQTFICELYDKQEAVIISHFTSYTGQNKKKQRSPNPLKIPSDQISFTHLMCCLFSFFHQLQCNLYRRNAQVWRIKGESYILPQRPGSDQLLTFSFSQTKGHKCTSLSFLFKLQYNGTHFLRVYSFYFVFHCILHLFKNQALLKKTSRLYKAKIQAGE